MLAPEYRQKEFGVNEKLACAPSRRPPAAPIEHAQTLSIERGDVGPGRAECRQQRARHGAEARHDAAWRSMQALSDLADASGSGSMERKVQLLAELLNARDAAGGQVGHAHRASGGCAWACAIPRVLDALSLAKAGDKSLRPPLERAYNLSSDIGLVAETLYRDGPEALAEHRGARGQPGATWRWPSAPTAWRRS